MNEFYLIVAGSRSFEHYQMFKDRMNFYLKNIQDRKQTIHLVSGGANGADKLAERYAEEYGLNIHIFRPDWTHNGARAGYLRNAEMHNFVKSIADENHRGCICFWDGESKGTSHNFDLAKKSHTPLKVIRYKKLSIEVDKAA